MAIECRPGVRATLAHSHVYVVQARPNATLSFAYVKDDIMSVSVEQLRNDALSMRAPNPRLEPPWVEPVWGD